MDASAYLAPRQVALDVLVACLDKGQPLDDALAQHLGFPKLDPRDRAFVRMVLATTLRRLGEIDGVLGSLIERPLDDAASVALQSMRIGAAQLLFLGTPAHAAVDTSVRLVEQAGLPHVKGLVNAVLRRIARDGATLLGDRDPAHLNAPEWLWASWSESYGEDAARAEFWAGQLGGELLPGGTIRRPSGGNIPDLPGFAEGAWWVQDAAAAIPARLLGDISGKKVADLCAAPGGKTLQLCATGANVTAVDISGRRMARLGENLARAGFTAELVTSDVAKWTTTDTFDAILLDAPCSGTGTLRRHPDIAWLKDEEDVARLAVTQDRLLQRAVDLLKPGGTLVYVTCSLQEEEGAARIEGLLSRDSRVKRVPVTAEEMPELAEAVTPAGDVRTLPSMWAERGGIDGFYMARLTL
jgi:16S rRNA (cytosine967-C5)-methyltransferase